MNRLLTTRPCGFGGEYGFGFADEEEGAGD